ncbi:uncharacterized protein LOC129770275 isoform X5 [Toxorhynchites rutilus septentrionalis]|uniref:uncharacterized protein LOC129770275 isoform X5 n=1 Tax=Toxorhynchites rutilus septentrionalis TaxID=329112 RepID=UPI00247B162B|nr:uncharacterized protein LOC129770275 isoform X5 [Toxorhynchites rutilus septentrionalis]
MWNKLFKSKSKSSKNLSNNGSTSAASTLDLVPVNNDHSYSPEVELRSDGDQELRRNQNRDSIETQMCGIPMRRSKLSNAFKSLSLRRGSSKNQLKFYAGAGDIAVGADEIEISTVDKRASLRPSKSDNNLNEKQNYADQEKENDPEYNEEYRPVVDPFLEIPDPPENLELQRCPICARNFVPTSLVKHIGICEKMQTKKRKPFDSSRQRREGTELASYLPKNFGLPQNHPQTRTSPPKTIPTQKHNINKTPNPERKDYGSAMSCSQTLSSTTAASTNNVAVGATSTPRPALKRNLSQQNEPCPYCERCFGFKAYDRHVEWCREKALLSKNVQNSQMISAAKERLQARIQYKAPQIRSKRALNREKYSGSLSCGGSTNSLADLDLPLPRHRSHLNSMSSSISSDNKSDHSASSKKLSLNGSNSQFQPSMVKSMGAAEKREQRTNPLTVGSNNNSNPPNDKTRTGKIFSNNLLIRPTQEVRKEKEQAVAVERIEKMELIGRGDQRVPLKRGATKIVKCNKSDDCNLISSNHTNTSSLVKNSTLKCTPVAQAQESKTSLASIPSFETYEEFFYYYEKQERLKSKKASYSGKNSEGGDWFEEEDLEIPFTNTVKQKSGRRKFRCGLRGSSQSGERDEDLEPPFYDCEERRTIVEGGGSMGKGMTECSTRKKHSRIPKKFERDTGSHELYNTKLEMHEDEFEDAEHVDSISGSGGSREPPEERLSRRFYQERVECFEPARDRDEITQYHETCTSEEADTKHPVPQQPPNRTRESPQVPRRGRAVGDLVEPLATTTIRNLPSLPTSSATSQPMEKSPSSQSMKSNITVPIGAYKPANDTNNNSSHIRNGPTATRLGNGNNSFNSPLPTTVRHQQQQKQQQNQLQSSAMNNNTISTHSLPQPYTTTGSPLFDNPSHKHQSSLTSSNGIGHNGAGGGGIMFDDLSPTERDLMKSVQELDRMCESSSSMYPADSDEMSSVEGYPLSASSRGHNSGRPSAEGSKFSADSAYGSLSRHSPSDQQHTIRRAHHHHHLHRGNKSNPSQQDAFDNSSGSESSLPPISATLKTQKAELHPHKDHKTVVDSMGNLAGPMSKFCHECGSRFMINTAKFCMECGVRRIMLE